MPTEPISTTTIIGGIVALISVIGSAIVAPLLAARNQAAAARRDDFKAVTERLEKQLQDQQEEVHRLQAENRAMATRLAHLESNDNDLPFPVWMKDLSWTYVWVNSTFATLFLFPNGKTAQDIIGESDAFIWNKEVAQMLHSLSHEALHSPSRQAFKSSVVLDDRITGTWTVFKFPLFRGNVQTGWMGLALPEGVESTKTALAKATRTTTVVPED